VVAPHPRHPSRPRVNENTAADGIELIESQLERLNSLEPAAGGRHDEANTGPIYR